MKKTILLLIFSILVINTYAQKKVYYDNGNLKQIGQYDTNGKATGVWKFYYEDVDGQLKDIGKYEKGSATGEWKSYYNGGEFLANGKYEKGKRTGEWKFYYVDGKLLGIDNYENGIKNGQSKKYGEYEKGLVEVGNYEDGKKNGVWKFYHEDGTFSTISKYENGKKNGDHKEYYSDGKLKVSTKFENGKKNGEHKEYYRNGEMRYRILWQKDKLMDIISNFDTKGNPMKKGTLINANGTVHMYDDSGTLIETVTYINGGEK